MAIGGNMVANDMALGGVLFNGLGDIDSAYCVVIPQHANLGSTLTAHNSAACNCPIVGAVADGGDGIGVQGVGTNGIVAANNRSGGRASTCHF